MTTSSDQSAGSNRRALTIVAVVTVLVLLVAGVLLSDSGDGEDPAASRSVGESPGAATDLRATEQRVGLARRDADDVAALGEVDAPIVLIEYSDYRCPFCGAFARDTLPELVEDYVDTGKVRFEWRDYPVFGEESMLGAMAARAAGEQGRFWQMQGVMYAAAPERGHLEINRTKVIAWAKEVGVPDMAQFEDDLDDEDLRSQVEQDASEANKIGATGTPTFVLGDRIIVGAQPTEAFRTALDEQLRSAGEE